MHKISLNFLYIRANVQCGEITFVIRNAYVGLEFAFRISDKETNQFFLLFLRGFKFSCQENIRCVRRLEDFENLEFLWDIFVEGGIDVVHSYIRQ